MKYPLDQYAILKETIGLMGKYIDVINANPHALHFEVFNQYSDGHKHNSLVTVDGVLMKRHKVDKTFNSDALGVPFEPLTNRKYDFKLYPEGCHDDHIETAMKRVLKEYALEITK